MSHWYINKTRKLFLVVALLVLQISFAQDLTGGDPVKGKDLFKANCSSCHATDTKEVGPALKGVYSRGVKDNGLDLEWFKKWIKDNAALRNSGDAYANKVFNDNGKVPMTAFPNLADGDIVNILTYLEDPSKAPDKKKEEPKAIAKDKKSNAGIWIAFFVTMALLVWLIIKLTSLIKLTRDPELSPSAENQINSFSDFYTKNKPAFNIGIAIFGILALWSVWAWLMGIGVDKGYRPEQPIYFSHKIHVGINNIDCQLCHSGAKYGKVSEIPSVNVCMNCHKGIKEYNGEYMEEGKDKKFYDSQIDELFKYAGYDKANNTYTGKTEQIKWTRIHNMPDFVYFNHSQHVVAGEQAILKAHNAKNPNNQIDVVCKACHGKIDTMNVVEMANDFTMQFCIDCHRDTEIDLGNNYNAHYFKALHDKVKKNSTKGEKITVSKIGGIECGKCHY